MENKCRNCGAAINPKAMRQDFCTIECHDAFTDWMDVTETIAVDPKKEAA